MEFDFKDNSSELVKELLKVSQNTPKLLKKEFRKVGKNAAKTIRKEAKKLVGKTNRPDSSKHKSYHKRFKGSKVWEDIDGSLNVSAYNSAPHAHLIEYGHRKVNRNGVTKGFVEGLYPIKRGANKYLHSEFERDINNIITKAIEKGGLK